MPTISTTFKLIDDFSPGLKKINDSMGGVTGAFTKLKSILGGLSPAPVTKVDQATQKLDQDTKKLSDSTQNSSNSNKNHIQILENLNKTVNKVSSGFKTAIGAISAIGGTTAIIAGAKKAMDWSDEVTDMNTRLELVNKNFNQLNGSSQTLEEFNKSIFKAAQSAGAPLDDMKNLIVSLGQNASSAFSSTDEITDFGTELNKAFQITGVSGQQASAAMLQLTQGLASGKLQGDEFESMMENAPGVMGIIAKQLGVTTGQLRDMSTAGEITADTFVNALLGAKGSIDDTFNSMPVTFDMMFTEINNTIQEETEPIATALNQAFNSAPVQQAIQDVMTLIQQNMPLITQLVTGAIQQLPGLISNITKALDWMVNNGQIVQDVLIGIGVAFAAIKIGGLVSAFTSLLNPVGLTITLITALGAGLIYLWNTNEGFRNFVTNAWNAISGAVQEAITIIQLKIDAFIVSYNAIKEAAVNFYNTFINSWNALIGWFGSIPAKMRAIANSIIDGFKQGLLDKWNSVKSWFQDKFGGLVNTVKGVLQIHSPSKLFVDIGSNLVQGVQVGADKSWKTVKNSFASNFNDLANIQTPNITPSVSPTLATNSINTNNYQNQLNGVTDSVDKTLTTVSTNSDTGLSAVSDNLTTQMTNMNTYTSSSLDDMVDIVNTHGQTFIEDNNTNWSAVLTDTVNLVTQMHDQVIALTDSMVEAIKSVMAQLPSYFSSTAIQMMNGLISGMNSKRAATINTTSSLVQAIKNAFITGLGIHSPALFGDYVGRMLGAGIIQGLNSSQLTSFVQSIIESMKSSFRNGKFNADELVNYLGKDPSLSVVKYLELIGDQTVSDLFGDGGTPAIIQEALKYVGYAPGGGNSMFGLHYGNAGAWCASFVRYCAEKVGVPFPPTNYVPDVLDWSIATGKYTQTPQPGYAAIFGGGSHIELVAGVGADGTVDMVGGNTGRGEVKHRPRSDATSYVALDGGHSTKTLKDTIMQAWNKKYNPLALLGAGGGSIAYNPEAGVSQWSNVVLQALAMLGQPSSLLNGVLYAIQSESGGNPNAVNNYDINAQRGDPSRGLLQTIGSTFEAYRNPSLPDNIFDPLANVYAALNYMIQRYGSIGAVVNPRMGHWYGYASGTNYARSGLAVVGENGPELLNFRGGESVANAQATRNLLNYGALGNQLAIDSLMSSQGNQVVNNYFDIDNEINNHGDLNNAEQEIYQVITSALEQEYSSSSSARR